MLVRYRQPWHLSSRVNREFDQLMNEAFGSNTTRSFSPAANVVTEGSDVVVRLAVAGVPAGSLDVTLNGRKLIVSGERPEPEVADGDRVITRELRSGPFKRVFQVAEGTTSDQISADLTDGILSVRVAGAAKPADESHKITVAEGGAKSKLEIEGEVTE